MYIVDFEDGCRLISAFIEYYNTQPLHSAIGYVTPVDKLNGREALIVRQREDKLQAPTTPTSASTGHARQPFSSLIDTFEALRLGYSTAGHKSYALQAGIQPTADVPFIGRPGVWHNILKLFLFSPIL
jgi:hypothetical protein